MLDVLIRKANVNGAIVDIAVNDGVIVDIDNEIYGDAKVVFDAKKRITIPGFVDCHTHLDKCLLNYLELIYHKYLEHLNYN